LTKDAFNALLKTLEEPPAHVIFILATTELDKVLETIISRCQLFTFKKPSRNLLQQMVIDIAKKEGFTITSESAELIALLGDGAFRDTLGLVQKVISASPDKKVPHEFVETVTGAPSSSLVNTVISSIAEKNIQTGLAAVAQAVEENIDMNVFLKLIMYKVRLILLVRFGGKKMNTEIENDVSDSDFEFVQSMAGIEGKAINSQLLVKLIEAHNQLRYSFLPQIPLELVLGDVIAE
jgi:DNA polymerase-3 subunit gamma/tau